MEQVITGEQEIKVAFDETRRHVVFDRWGEIAGKGADLLIALAGPFRDASSSTTCASALSLYRHQSAHSSDQVHNRGGASEARAPLSE